MTAVARLGLRTHPLIRALRGLGLPPEHFVVFGSGPLLAHGLRTDLGDLDIVARGPAWDYLTRGMAAQPAPSGHGSMVRLVIEAADRWLPGFDTDRLIDTAERYDGVPFAPLRAVRSSKRLTDRPKDRTDIALIDTALGGEEVAA